jgi:hypothetical protein
MSKTTKKSIELSEPLLADTLGLTRLRANTPELAHILNAAGTLNDSDKALLHEVRILLLDNADAWNEEELKMQFISFIMFLAHFNAPIRSYYDREIDATIGQTYIKCKADMLLAKGIGELIKIPYFFLHEYKREKKYSGDPIGQMLGGMLIAQAKNNNGKPTYGCYVQGRFWFFSVLVGKEYVVSQSFDATNEAVAEQIISILRELKHVILSELMD